jgi:hypothetical protein
MSQQRKRRRAEEMPENKAAVETLKTLHYIYLELSLSPHHRVREYAKRYRFTIFHEALRSGLNMQAIARLTALSPHAVSNILLGEEIEILPVDDNGVPEAYVDVDEEIAPVKNLPLLSQLFDEVAESS